MASAEEVKSIFPAMVERFLPEKAVGLEASILFDLSGANGGLFWMTVADGKVATGEGAIEAPAMTMRASADDWHAVATGQLNPMQAFMSGKIKIQGDMGLALKLQMIFAQ